MARTWKQFKEDIEAAGVQDNDVVDYIDVSYDEEIVAQRESENDSWGIYS